MPSGVSFRYLSERAQRDYMFLLHSISYTYYQQDMIDFLCNKFSYIKITTIYICFSDKGLPKAMVKPSVLTHVIEGFVIQESPEPFAVSIFINSCKYLEEALYISVANLHSMNCTI